MKITFLKEIISLVLFLLIGISFILYQTTSISEACTRVVYQGTENMTITGRSMDWKEDMHSDLWLFPRGIKRDALLVKNPQSGLLNMEA